MIRFIYVCMGVVALSALSIAGQYMFSGLDDSYQSVLDRNSDGSASIAAAPQDETPDAAVQQAEAEISPEDLNAIESAAGGLDDANKPDEFGARFTGQTPAALGDTPDTTNSVQPAALD